MNLEIRGVTYHLEVEGNPATEPTAILLHGFSGSCAVPEHCAASRPESSRRSRRTATA